MWVTRPSIVFPMSPPRRRSARCCPRSALARSSQDIERRGRILEALNRLQGMFQQILLITHMEDIHERVPNMLRVTEDDARDASVDAF